MIVHEVTQILEAFAPLDHAEDFDNVGLLIGNPNMEVTGILVTLDTLENVVDEAITSNCNLIVSFHPIIFSGLKRLNGSTYVERVTIKAIKHDIAVYSMHTALDNNFNGVNAKICEVLGLVNKKILLPKKGMIKKLTTYVPEKHVEALKTALFNAGAGHIGNYSHCSFSSTGTGSFKGEEGAKPTLGQKGEVHHEEEIQLQVTFRSDRQKKVLAALFESHPYEEVAYEVITLENSYQQLGMGMIGELESPMDEKAFLQMVKERMHCGGIRHTKLLGKKSKQSSSFRGKRGLCHRSRQSIRGRCLFNGRCQIPSILYR